MEFTFEMNYNQKSMTAMAKAIRKGLQEEQDKKSKIIGWIFVALAAVVLLFSGKTGWMQIIGGILVVLLETMAKAYISTELSDAVVFAVLIIILLVKPAGLLGKQVTEKV